jgi:hypothetical protein
MRRGISATKIKKEPAGVKSIEIGHPRWQPFYLDSGSYQFL